MITVHHLENSRSQRVLWLLEELGVEYQVKHYKRNPVTSLAPPELKAVHPLGKSPVITDDRADGSQTIAESGAIIEYLVEKYGNGRLIPPTGTPERLRYTYWLHYAEGTMMPLLVMTLIFNRVETSPMPFFIRPIAKGISAKVKGAYLRPNLEANFSYIEDELGKSPWFAGNEFTAADIQMSFTMEAAAARGGPDAGRPKSKAYLERIHARPAYKRALEKGGPLKLLS